MPTLYIVAGNVFIITILTIAGFYLKWMGPGYALGVMTGVFVFLIYFRVKYGVWP